MEAQIRPFTCGARTHDSIHHTLLVLSFLVAVASVAIAPARAQCGCGWQQIAATSGPVPGEPSNTRRNSFAQNPGPGGGLVTLAGTGASFGTYVLQNGQWTLVASAPGSPGRVGYAMVYDPTRNVVVLVAGGIK